MKRRTLGRHTRDKANAQTLATLLHRLKEWELSHGYVPQVPPLLPRARRRRPA